MGCGYDIFIGSIHVEPELTPTDFNELKNELKGDIIDLITTTNLSIEGEKLDEHSIIDSWKKIIDDLSHKNYKLNGVIYCEANSDFEPAFLIIKNNNLKFVSFKYILKNLNLSNWIIVNFDNLPIFCDPRC